MKLDELDCCPSIKNKKEVYFNVNSFEKKKEKCFVIKFTEFRSNFEEELLKVEQNRVLLCLVNK